EFGIVAEFDLFSRGIDLPQLQCAEAAGGWPNREITHVTLRIQSRGSNHYLQAQHRRTGEAIDREFFPLSCLSSLISRRVTSTCGSCAIGQAIMTRSAPPRTASTTPPPPALMKLTSLLISACVRSPRPACKPTAR